MNYLILILELNNVNQLEVQKIITCNGLQIKLLDIFTDLKKVTKSHVPATNAPIKINIPEGQDNESRVRQKRGRPLNSKDKNPRMKKELIIKIIKTEERETPKRSPEETLDMMVPEEPQVPENEEISIN